MRDVDVDTGPLLNHGDNRAPFGRAPYARIGEMLAVIAMPDKFELSHQKNVHILVCGPSNIGKSSALNALLAGPLAPYMHPLNFGQSDEKYLFGQCDVGTLILYSDECDPKVASKARAALFQAADPKGAITIRKIGYIGQNTQVRGLLFVSNKYPREFEDAFEQDVPSGTSACIHDKYTVPYNANPGTSSAPNFHRKRFVFSCTGTVRVTESHMRLSVITN